ncbi:MAG: hypothetical protein RL616_1014 [Verrucomicrobiota bacterium]|jgi:hypothetical protein
MVKSPNHMVEPFHHITKSSNHRVKRVYYMEKSWQEMENLLRHVRKPSCHSARA